MLHKQEPCKLVMELPPQECQSVPGYDPRRSLTADEGWSLIKDLCAKHRGEVREINGGWHYVGTPWPTDKKFFHPQYCLSYKEAKQRIPWTGKPAFGGKGAGKSASGGKGAGKSASDGKDASKQAYEENTFLKRPHSGAGHLERMATVTGLPELFFLFGHMATAVVAKRVD